MNPVLRPFLHGHAVATRRFFLRSGVAGLVGAHAAVAVARQRDPKLQRSLDALESWLTRPDDFRDVSRGTPLPHSLPEEQRKQVGLTRDTWKLEVVSDPENPAKLGRVRPAMVKVEMLGAISCRPLVGLNKRTNASSLYS